MTATVAGQAALRALTDDELLAAYSTSGETGQAAVLAEAARRDRADAARKARQAAESAWMDAAFAEYLAAEQATKGRMLSREGMARGPSDPFGLWRLPERQALRFASEELREHWLDHPRLSLAGYRRQLAAAKRAERDERELAAVTATTAPVPASAWTPVPGGSVRLTTVRVNGALTGAWWSMTTAGVATLHRSREAAEQALAPVPALEAVTAEPEPAETAASLPAETVAREHADGVTVAYRNWQADPGAVTAPWAVRCERHGLVALAATIGQADTFADSHLATLHRAPGPVPAEPEPAPVEPAPVEAPPSGGLDLIFDLLAAPEHVRVSAPRRIARRARAWIATRLETLR